MNTETFKRLCRAVDLAGWRYLLPAAGRRRVLCLDIGHGAATLALAQSCQEVISVPLHADDHAHIERRIDQAGVENVRVFRTIAEACASQPDLDGVVTILFRADLAGHRGRHVRAQLRRAASAARDGYLLLGLPNALGYNARLRPWSAGLWVHGARAVERLAGKNSERSTRTWPVLLHSGAPFEVLHGPYRAPGGSRRRSERIKQFLLGPRGRRWFAPGFLVLSAARESELAVDQVLSQVDEATGDTSRVRRQLAMRDKTILVTEGEGRGHIVVLPRTPQALERRQREAGVLRAAESLPAKLSGLFPRVEGEGVYEGQAWFAIERMPGEFIDEPVPDLDAISQRAAGVLIDLHEATRHDVVVDETVYAERFAPLLTSARERHPGSDAEFARIDAEFRRALLGRRFPFVWMHGDYKIENVGIHPLERKPVSIIDCELSDPMGFPLIDLKYLLAYNRMIRGKCQFDTVHQLVADGIGWTRAESDLLDSYCETLGLDDELRDVLRVLFIVQSVGARLQYDLDDPQERARFEALLAGARRLLRRLAATRRGDAA